MSNATVRRRGRTKSAAPRIGMLLERLARAVRGVLPPISHDQSDARIVAAECELGPAINCCGASRTYVMPDRSADSYCKY